MDIPAIAHRTTLERLALLVEAPGAAIRCGPGWTAVRTGQRSNDRNVVLSDATATLSRAGVHDLVDWFDGVPASWQLASADDALAAMLVNLGATAERTGWWCGRDLEPASEAPSSRGVGAVVSESSREQFLDVLAECGWFDPDERPLRRAHLSTHPRLRHVVAVCDGRAVGAGTGFAGTALEIVDVAVIPDARRRGAGRAIVEELLHGGRSAGIEHVFAAPSPDGAELFRAMGFGFARVTPDLCFYLPGGAESVV